MSAFNRAAAALMLFAALAMSVEAGWSDPNYYPFYCNRGYPKSYYKKYYSGNIETDFVAVKSVVTESYYNDCVSYEKDVKITIYLCLLASQCFDAKSMSPCCSSDGVQYESECVAQCMGLTSSDYTMGACSSSVDVTVVDGSNSDSTYTTSSDMTSSSSSSSTDGSASYVATVVTDSSTPSPCASTGSGSSYDSSSSSSSTMTSSGSSSYGSASGGSTGSSSSNYDSNTGASSSYGK